MIVVAFALEFEGAAFRARSRWSTVETWFLGATSEKAAQSLRRCIAAEKPRTVISAGFAGALQPGLRVGTPVLGLNYTSEHLAERLSLSAGWLAGNIETADAIIETAEEKRALGEATGALVGDLETAHLFHVCQLAETPMISIRVVSDLVEEDLPVPADALIDPATSRPNPLALFRYLLTNPKSISGFRKLMRDAKIAQRQIERSLGEVIPQLLKRAA